MKKQNPAPAPLTKKDLSALVDLATTLDAFGVYDICAAEQYRNVHLVHERLAEAMKASGAKLTVTVDTGGIGRSFHGEFHFAGIKFYGVLYEDDLPTIGYHLIDGKPVPVDQTATA